MTSDRFRLIYLKSSGSEKSTFDEALPLQSKRRGLTKPLAPPEYPSMENFSSQEILKQAKVDLKHPDPKVRILAVKYYLEKSHLSITMPLLQEILSDSDPGVRAEALSSLIQFGNRIVSPLLKKHLRDDDPIVRMLALKGMFQFKEKMDLNLFMQFLSDPVPRVRRKVATLLGWTQMEGTLPILMEMSRDEDSKVRKAALFSLITLYPEEGEQCLMEALLDRDLEVRKWAKKYMNKMIEKTVKPQAASLSV